MNCKKPFAMLVLVSALPICFSSWGENCVSLAPVFCVMAVTLWSDTPCSHIPWHNCVFVSILQHTGCHNCFHGGIIDQGCHKSPVFIKPSGEIWYMAVYNLYFAIQAVSRLLLSHHSVCLLPFYFINYPFLCLVFSTISLFSILFLYFVYFSICPLTLIYIYIYVIYKKVKWFLSVFNSINFALVAVITHLFVFCWSITR